MGQRTIVLILGVAACHPARPVAEGFTIAAPATAVATPAPVERPAAHPLSDEAKACLGHAGPDEPRCHEGDAPSCYKAALASEGSCRATLLDHACGAEEAVACLDLGTALLGESSPRALEILQRGCDLGAGKACTLVADQAEPSPGSAGAALYTRACNLGHAVGCRKAGERATDREQAKGLLQRACERGDAKGCVELTDSVASGEERGPEQIARVKELLRRTCLHNDDDSDLGESCARLLNYSPDLQPAEQAAILSRGCHKGHDDSCRVLGRTAGQEGRYADAVDPYATLMARQPNDPYVLSFGLNYLYLGRFGEAIAPLEKALEIGVDRNYSMLFLHVARLRSGAADAKDKLRDAAQTMDRKDWPGPVVSFYLGELGEAELLRKAKHSDPRRQLEQECEAFFYIGERNLVDGDSRKAAHRFESAVGTHIDNFVEFHAARAELGRLTPKAR